MIRKNSALFWFTLIIPVGIIGIGINFILNPAGASAGYGIPVTDPNSFPYMWVKGIRDIFSGLVILPFLFRGDRKVTSILFAIAIFVPFCDGLVIIANSGFTAQLLVHWGTAFYMAVVSYFLLRKTPNGEDKYRERSHASRFPKLDLVPSGSMIHANFPFSAKSGPDTISAPNLSFAFKKYASDCRNLRHRMSPGS